MRAPAMTLLSGDQAVQEACGCRLVRGPSSAEMAVRFERCAMHDAGAEMKKALEAALHFMSTNAPTLVGKPHMQNAYSAVWCAIAVAEGRPVPVGLVPPATEGAQ